MLCLFAKTLDNQHAAALAAGALAHLSRAFAHSSHHIIHHTHSHTRAGCDYAKFIARGRTARDSRHVWYDRQSKHTHARRQRKEPCGCARAEQCLTDPAGMHHRTAEPWQYVLHEFHAAGACCAQLRLAVLHFGWPYCGDMCVQCLFYCPALKTYFLSGAYTPHITRTSPTKGRMAEVLLMHLLAQTC